MAFTWFDKFTGVVDAIPDEEKQAEFVLAMIKYGAHGIEPGFEDWALAALFELIRDDINNSVEARKTGAKGGRPKSENGGLSETENPQKPPVSETPKPPVSEIPEKPKTPSYIGLSLNQANTSQTKKKKERGGAFAPPTPADVKAYADEKGLSLDAERFVDTFAAQGWRLSNGNPMRDWQAAVRTWVARDAKWAAERGGKPQAVDDERRRRWDERYGGLE